MTYNELVDKIKKECSRYDASVVNEHLAIQFNIFGEGEGAFYVELADGCVNVEPYEYFDRDILISTTYDIALKIAARELDIQEEAYAGRLFAEGKLNKSSLLKELKVKEEKKAKKASSGKKAPKNEKKDAELKEPKKPAKKSAAAKTAEKKADETAKEKK